MARVDPDEAPFGTAALPGFHVQDAGSDPAPERGAGGDALRPGASVRLIAGPRRGAVAEFVDFLEVALPAGGSIRLARVRRPRAGDSIECLGSLVALS